MLGPIQETTITWFMHILTALDRAYWEHNSDELAAIDPKSIVANFQFPPPTATQRASDHTTPTGASTLEYSCNLGMGSLHPVAPKEVTVDRWSTTPRLVPPSMDPLAVPAWNEVREVRLPQPGASYNWQCTPRRTRPLLSISTWIGCPLSRCTRRTSPTTIVQSKALPSTPARL